MLQVAVLEGAPVLVGEGAEGGMGLDGFGLAAGGKSFDGFAEGGDASLQVAIIADDEFRGGRGAFGPGEDVNDQLGHWPDTEWGPFLRCVALPHGGEDRQFTVVDHLGNRHFAPDGGHVGPEGVKTGQERLAVGGVPNGLGHRGDCSGIC